MDAVGSSSALFTDRYELTMLKAALADGTASRHCSFEVFGRRLPDGRRFGVAGGIGRLLEAIAAFRFTPGQLSGLTEAGVIDDPTAEYLASYRFSGDIDGYAEGEPYFPYSPILSVRGTFAEAVLLETLALSILNHDSAIAAAAARMVVAAGDRPLIEMGSRRTHEAAAVSAARIAYLVGFASTSNLAAGERYSLPTAGTAAHAFILLHDTEEAAFASQIKASGVATTLLVDTYDIGLGIEKAVAVAGPALGAIRIDSGDLAVMAHQSRAQLDALGASGTKIVVSGDLDEYSIAGLAAAPVDIYGAGTAVVVGSGAPTAGLVYKLVEVDQRPVEKRSENKASRGGRKLAYRRHRASGTATEERVVLGSADYVPAERDRLLTVPLMRAGQPVDQPSLEQSRAHHRKAIEALPWEALKLSKGDPGLPVVFD
ncbi:nicotinate phosphoribosyltransferase [Jatrophihabitans sp. DSM 45814]